MSAVCCGVPRRRASDVPTSAPSTNFNLDAPPREGL